MQIYNKYIQLFFVDLQKLVPLLYVHFYCIMRILFIFECN